MAPGDRQHGRGRGTPARRDGGTVVPAGFAPGSICHQSFFDIVSRHFSRRHHADVAGRPGAGWGARNLALRPEPNAEIDYFWFNYLVVTAAAWLTLVGFFASTLSRSFLQAVGLGIATFFISFALLAHQRAGGFSGIPVGALLLAGGDRYPNHHRHPALAGLFELQKFPRRLAVVAAQSAGLCRRVYIRHRDQHDALPSRLGSF